MALLSGFNFVSVSLLAWFPRTASPQWSEFRFAGESKSEGSARGTREPSWRHGASLHFHRRRCARLPLSFRRCVRALKRSGQPLVFMPIALIVLYAVLFAAGTIGLVAAVLAFALGVVGGIANNANQFMVSRSAPEAPDFSNCLYLTAANLGTTLGTSLCGMFITLEGTQSSVFGAVAFLVVGVLCVLWRLRCVGGCPQARRVSLLRPQQTRKSSTFARLLRMLGK